MKNLIKLEEASMLALAFYLSTLLDYGWWMFILFLFTPDLSMIGYLLGNKTGAIIYNLFHHKFLAIAVGIAGHLLALPIITFTGIILFGHSSLDRIMGFGLKQHKGFNYTHLGAINKNKN